MELLHQISKSMLLAIVLSVLSISCSAETDAVEVIKETPVKVVKKVEKSKGNLVIYSGRKESLIGPVIDQFKSISGINI